MSATGRLTGMLVTRHNFAQPTVLLGLAFYCALLPMLQLAPYWFSTNPGIASEAAAQGYNNSAAYYLVVLWSVGCIVAFTLFTRSRHSSNQGRLTLTAERPFSASRVITGLNILEIATVCALCLVIYFPWSLARYGPYIEDNYVLTALHRMEAGQLPYLDFEFPYGPLMLYMAHGWIKLNGYTMPAYFALIALLAALQYSIVVRVLQHFLPTFRLRLGAFVLVGALCFDTLLGLNYNGIRRLLPVFVLILVASRPTSIRTLIAASLLLGLVLGYSHDVGVCVLLSVFAMYGLMAIESRSWRCAKHALIVSALSVAVWFASTVLVLGRAFPSYIKSSVFVLKRFSAGESGFAFYWTVNSLSVFALLILACIILGRGLGKRWPTQIISGDRLFFAAFVYALFGLKSGLNRADMWHLASPMFALVFAFILPYPRNLFVYSKRVHKLVLTSLVVMAVTYFAGLAPSGSYLARGLMQGSRDLATSRPSGRSLPVVTRAPSIELDRSYPDQNVLALATYLADKSRADKPVVFYSILWSLDKRVGVFKSTYPTDDFLLSEHLGDEVREFVSRETPIVVMDDQSYARLFDDSKTTMDRTADFYEETTTKEILRWLSSIHFTAVQKETKVKAERWDRTVGSYLQTNYYRAASFGWYAVLEKKEFNREGHAALP